ncbi:MAG: glycosyltransferase family 39 protein [Acidimicrobiia bacterium]|nr:glycosyltransferase family 39 protein [Acidimicrobiia bacterium]
MPASSRPTRRFLTVLALICFLGASIRVSYVVFFKPAVSPCAATQLERNSVFESVRTTYFIGRAPENICGDALVYHDGANLLAKGEGFISPIRFIYTDGVRFNSADHPPLYMLYLAGFSVVGLDGVLAHQLASCFLGVVSIAIIGLLGRRLANERAGLIAAFLASIYVYIWINDALVMSETIAITATAALLLLTYRYVSDSSRRNLVFLGLIAGVTVMTRAELLLFIPLVMPFIAWRVSHAWRPFLLRLLAIGALAGAVMAPWVIRNLTTFEKPVTLSTGVGITLTYTNCDATYYGDLLGYWNFPCIAPVPNEADQSLDEALLRKRGIDYITSHKSRIPVVVMARVGRQWGLYRPMQHVEKDVYDDRPAALSRIGLAQYYAFMALATGGAVVLYRRKVWLWPLLSMFVIVTITAATSYGTTRFRTPAEVSTVVLAGIAIDVIVNRWRRRTAVGPAPEPGIPPAQNSEMTSANPSSPSL